MPGMDNEARLQETMLYPVLLSMSEQSHGLGKQKIP